jgi:hypothetical protein
MTRAVSVAELRERLAGPQELALVDVREQGVHYRGHPFFAVSLPLSHLEMRAAELLPRRSAPIVALTAGGRGSPRKLPRDSGSSATPTSLCSRAAAPPGRPREASSSAA